MFCVLRENQASIRP